MFRQVKVGDKKELMQLSIKQMQMIMAYRRDSYEREYPPLRNQVPPTPANTPTGLKHG